VFSLTATVVPSLVFGESHTAVATATALSDVLSRSAAGPGSAAFSETSAQSRTAPFQATSTFPTSLTFAFAKPISNRTYPRPTSAFTETRFFAPNQTASASAPFHATATFATPVATVNVQAETFSFSATISLSLTVSQSVEISINQDGSLVIIVHTAAVVISLPVYTLVRSSVSLELQAPVMSPNGQDGLSASVIIGVASGAALIFALVLGAGLYIVRSRMAATYEVSSAGEVTRTKPAGESVAELDQQAVAITVEEARSVLTVLTSMDDVQSPNTIETELWL
jgi:hypothetical protein